MCIAQVCRIKACTELRSNFYWMMLEKLWAFGSEYNSPPLLCIRGHRGRWTSFKLKLNKGEEKLEKEKYKNLSNMEQIYEKYLKMKYRNTKGEILKYKNLSNMERMPDVLCQHSKCITRWWCRLKIFIPVLKRFLLPPGERYPPSQYIHPLCTNMCYVPPSHLRDFLGLLLHLILHIIWF